jgi:lactoylglutathione lyase
MFKLLTTFLSSLLINPVFSCSPSSLLSLSRQHKRGQASGTPIYTAVSIGTDPPADKATLGFKMAHIALFVNDLVATKHFYGDVLGMRQIFHLEATGDYSILYMAHAQGGRNGSGYMTGDEMMRELYNMSGLIEFISLKVLPLYSPPTPPSILRPH